MGILTILELFYARHFEVSFNDLVFLYTCTYIGEQLVYIRTHHKGKTLPSVHVLGAFNLKDIDWPDILSKQVNRKVQGVPESQTTANSRHKEKEKNDKI